jgi:hypothetical protein
MFVQLWDVTTGALLLNTWTTDRKDQLTDTEQDMLAEIAAIDRQQPRPQWEPSTGSLTTSETWIKQYVIDILWLPPLFREGASEVYGKTMAIGHANGTVSFFHART